MVALVLSFFVVLEWFPLSTQIPFQKYGVFAAVFCSVWLVSAYLMHRYVRVKYQKIDISIYRLLFSATLTFGVMLVYMYAIPPRRNYSIWVLLTIWIVMVAWAIVILIISHAYNYATYAEPEPQRTLDRGPQPVLRAPVSRDAAQVEAIRKVIADTASPLLPLFLDKYLDISSSNTFVLRSAEMFNILKLRDYRFDVIINLMPLNQIRGINHMFGVINDKLPDDGLYVCCYEPQSTTKRKMLTRFTPVFGWMYYFTQYLFKRVLPKIFMTERLYFDLTEGKDRILSKAEVLGRLCYCGFEIVAEHKYGDLTYVIARRSFTPATIHKKRYGILVQLERVGKNGQPILVYKFRTMHPYSEYIQSYIYDKYSLQAGGKFKRDIRVTTTGRWLRKAFVDEWPMLLNLFQGDVKLIGVRPISQQYLSLYSPELQEKRLHHKPGLMPPFYADMPSTLEEIQQSEMRYLNSCERRGTFLTDIIYFFKISVNLLFRHAHSN